MALSARHARRQPQTNFWPGFVDAMSTLLLVFVFLLSIFMVVQFLLEREISGRDTVLNRLRNEIAELSDMLALEKTDKSRLETSLAELSNNLEIREKENSRLQARLDQASRSGGETQTALSNLRGKLADERKLSASALARVELLNRQIAALRRQIAALDDALAASEKRSGESEKQITDLGRRLNAALARRVQELAGYRSEFFGVLRKILGQYSGVHEVGDRFVFQSEVLFPKASAQLNDVGRGDLDMLAGALKDLETKIPPNINWVLRVDGHTDTDPINTAVFPSNWELSTARAIAVVKYLINRGVPPKRLVAAGFSSYHPIERGDGEAAKQRNRRIELKLTGR